MVPVPFESISSLLNLFWSRVARKGPDDCWLWRGPKTGSRLYGAFCFNGKYVYAHRFCYTLHHGAIPAGTVVRHICDEPLCVNPRHLRAGSQKANIQDALARDRWMTKRRRAYLAKPPERDHLGRFVSGSVPL